jgi:hypothetical protein
VFKLTGLTREEFEGASDVPTLSSFIMAYNEEFDVPVMTYFQSPEIDLFFEKYV